MFINQSDVQAKMPEILAELEHENSCVLINLSNHKDCIAIKREMVEFIGYMPTDLITIAYLEDCSDYWEVTNSEHYPADKLEDALAALHERLADPNLTHSSKAIPFESYGVKA